MTVSSSFFALPFLLHPPAPTFALAGDSPLRKDLSRCISLRYDSKRLCWDALKLKLIKTTIYTWSFTVSEVDTWSLRFRAGNLGCKRKRFYIDHLPGSISFVSFWWTLHLFVLPFLPALSYSENVRFLPRQIYIQVWSQTCTNQNISIVASPVRRWCCTLLMIVPPQTDLRVLRVSPVIHSFCCWQKCYTNHFFDNLTHFKKSDFTLTRFSNTHRNPFSDYCWLAALLQIDPKWV